MADQFVEQALLLRIRGGGVFGMPLCADDPPCAVELDGVDDAVDMPVDDVKSIAQPVEGLVVDAMALFGGVGAHGLGDPRPWIELD